MLRKSIGPFCRLWFLCCCQLLIQYAHAGESTTTTTSNTFHYHYYEAPEPYDELNGFYIPNKNGNPTDLIPESPDPLVSYRWNDTVDDTKLQYYRVREFVSYQDSPKGCATSSTQEDGSFAFTVLAVHHRQTNNCTLRMDWGVERAAWMELISTNDLSSNHSSSRVKVRASLSEFDMEYPGKTMPLTTYGNHTYRLETNEELYEGVRFTWLYFEFLDDYNDTDADGEGLVILDISLVAKIKPINYTGSFHSSDTNLTKAWYTGAYGVRLNMEENNFNSILIERGDRVAIQGDGHPTIAASLVAFSPYSLVRTTLQQSDSGNHSVVDQGIMAYPLYWSLSVLDYVMESGDLDTFSEVFAKDIMKILNARIADFLSPTLDIQWFGWDDRLGNGWCFHSNGDHCPQEAHLAFAALVVRVCRDLAHVLDLANIMPKESQVYHETYQDLAQRLRSIPQWPKQFGVHAAANAINAGIATKDDTNFWMTSILKDPVNLCSVSQFNQYWILQSYGNVDGWMEQALASIKLCWKAPLELGKGCFWENSSPEWLQFLKEGNAAPGLPSYCHPWASGVTAWLSHYVGGIRPILPGYEQALVAPYFSEQYPTVKASILTPSGKIRVDGKLLRDGITVHVSVYSPVAGLYGVRSELHGPSGKPRAKLSSIVHRGGNEIVEPMTLQDVHAQLLRLPRYRNASSTFPTDHRFVSLKAGVTTNFTIFYHEINDLSTADNRSDIETPFPDPYYPAAYLGIDRLSGGSGLANHGSDGYLLLGHNNGTDVVRLPSYIRNVSVWQHGYPGWLQPQREFMGTSMDDLTYLVDVKATNGTTERRLGMVGYDNSRGGQINELFLHIETTDGGVLSPYALSVYFVAKSSDSKHAIRFMDFETLNVIAPTTIVQNYAGGVWSTLQYNKSVRLRLSNIKGIRVSAIAFGKPEEYRTGTLDYAIE